MTNPTIEELTADFVQVAKPAQHTLHGKVIHIKERLSALESLAHEADQMQLREAIATAEQATSPMTEQAKGLRFAAVIVKHHICNSQGKLIFADKSAEDLVGAVDGQWLEDLYQLVIQHRRGITLEDAEKNS